MAQQFCTIGQAAEDALLAYQTDATHEALHCQLPVLLTWESASPETVPEDTPAYAIPSNSAHVDSLHYVWLIVVYVGCAGAAHPILLVEQGQLAFMDTLLTGAGITTTGWAIWGRLVDGRVEGFQQ